MSRIHGTIATWQVPNVHAATLLLCTCRVIEFRWRFAASADVTGHPSTFANQLPSLAPSAAYRRGAYKIDSPAGNCWHFGDRWSQPLGRKVPTSPELFSRCPRYRKSVVQETRMESAVKQQRLPQLNIAGRSSCALTGIFAPTSALSRSLSTESASLRFRSASGYQSIDDPFAEVWVQTPIHAWHAEWAAVAGVQTASSADGAGARSCFCAEYVDFRHVPRLYADGVM